MKQLTNSTSVEQSSASIEKTTNRICKTPIQVVITAKNLVNKENSLYSKVVASKLTENSVLVLHQLRKFAKSNIKDLSKLLKAYRVSTSTFKTIAERKKFTDKLLHNFENFVELDKDNVELIKCRYIKIAKINTAAKLHSFVNCFATVESEPIPTECTKLNQPLLVSMCEQIFTGKQAMEQPEIIGFLSENVPAFYVEPIAPVETVAKKENEPAEQVAKKVA